MNKIEMHCKTKYSDDKEYTIDIKSILLNAKENKEKGIVFVDKDTIIAFPKIEKVYKELCEEDTSFRDFKIGYGVELIALINDFEYEIILLIKNNYGLKELYKIMSKYLTKYDKKIPIEELIDLDNCLLGLILNKESIKLDLSMFDYLEVNSEFDISNIKDKNKIIYSNIPNASFEEELKAKEVLYVYHNIDSIPSCRLYKDTKDTLNEFNNEELVITNSNMIFDNLDNVIINDDKFYITHVDNFNEFENLVRNNFKRKFKNPSITTINRLDEELNLIKDLDYTYVYILLMIITKFCKKEKEYYQLDGYINNSLVAYILELTEIEPFNLPYELFFSEIPKIEFIVSPDFYNNKLFKYIMDKFKDELIRCSYHFKLNHKSINRVIKHYEIKKKCKINSDTKDYICNTLDDIPLYKENKNHMFYFILNDKDVFDFSPTMYLDNKLKVTHYDYHDLKNNLISIRFILNEDIKNISYLINKTNSKVKFCNDKRVFNLFRNTEEFECNFNILDKLTGTLNIRYFSDSNLESKLINISNIWSHDLVDILMDINHGIIKDDLYNNLKKRNLDDVNIFNVINCLEDSNKLLVPKSFILNKIRLAYNQMYYKLYYSKEYYDEILLNIDYSFIDDKVYNYSFDDIKKRYFELNELNKIDLNLQEKEELKLLEILIEMYERGIKYFIKDKRIIIN